jgi:hypothetical protein
MVLLDYLVVARAGRLVRAVGPSFGLLSDDHLAMCRRLGRRERVDPEDAGACMDSAGIFWLDVAGISVLLLAASILLAPHGATPLWMLWVRAVPFLLFTFTFATAGSSYGFALVRSRFLDDGVFRPRTGAVAVRVARRAARPRARDFFLCCLFGVFMTVVAASQIPPG